MMKATYDSATDTIAVTHNGATRTFKAFASGFGSVNHVSFAVFAVRYPTGAKVWPASVTVWSDGTATFEASGYGRGARQSGATSVVGWWADMDPANCSQVSR